MRDDDPSDNSHARTELEEALASGQVPAVVVEALEEARRDAKGAEDRMLRALAETENQRRRLRSEQEREVRFANESLVVELLDVLDSLDLCLDHADGSGSLEDLRRGVTLTRNQFLQALENIGAERIEVGSGDPFDPNAHEAIMRDDTSPLPRNSVVAVARPGYRYHDRVVRPARVVVSGGGGAVG